jgi:HAMP domain-containing protein
MKDLFFFETMLTPKIITVLYWLLLLGVLVSGLGALFTGRILYGIGTLILGALAVRIWCELAIVLFKINDHAKIIAGNPTSTPNEPVAPTPNAQTEF